jgi:uncharacterized protein YjbI with pentapeptide repeats
MADKLDPLDVGALEGAVNDSAGRVSGLWLSFVAFSAYLAAAASMISHRQIFLEEPIRLPTINIDLPLVASAILLPLLFVIYHVFVLLQVVLLARTADAYNDAIEHGVADPVDQTRVRQRLANTLFAQLFAGSPREREGVLGWLLRLMAWITLAIAPVFVLILFEIKFLPYHSALITWTHRTLIAIDLLVVLYLWAGAIKPANDIRWQSLLPHWKIATCAAVVILACSVLVTFPGEPSRAWMRLITSDETWREDSPECRFPRFIEAVIRPDFDRLVLVGEDFVDNDKLEKIVKIATENGLGPHETERTRVFRGRDLRCARLAGADLSHSEFISADLSGASLKAAHLEGSTFSGANLSWTNLDGSRLHGSWFGPYPLADGTTILAARMSHTYLRKAQLQGANLAEVDFKESALDGALLGAANLSNAKLSKATMFGAMLAGADLTKARMQALSLRAVDLRGATLVEAELQRAEFDEANLNGANLAKAHLAGASLSYAQLQGANLSSAEFQGARLGGAKLMGAMLEYARLETADLSSADLRGVAAERANLAGADNLPHRSSRRDIQGGDAVGSFPLGRAPRFCLPGEREVAGDHLGQRHAARHVLGRHTPSGSATREQRTHGRDLRKDVPLARVPLCCQGLRPGPCQRTDPGIIVGLRTIHAQRAGHGLAGDGAQRHRRFPAQMG